MPTYKERFCDIKEWGLGIFFFSSVFSKFGYVLSVTVLLEFLNGGK